MAWFVTFPLLLGLLIHPASSCDAEESQVLLSFKSAFRDTSGALGTWRPDTECCQWRGITCNSEGRVVSLNMTAAAVSLTTNGRDEQVSTQVSSNLSQLTSLRVLDLSNLNLSCPFPSFTSLSNLEFLSLSNCNLLGNVSASISQLSATLRHLDISYNFLDGDESQFSATICTLKNLEVFLMVGSPGLVGSIPPCLATLKNLTFLDMSSSEISQNIPGQLSSLTSLRYLDLSNNVIAGGLDILCSLTQIEYLYLDMAFDGTGSISLPDCIGNLASALEVRLSTNYLVGRIPESIGAMASLQTLVLDGNVFVTEVPSSLGNLSMLRTLILNRDSTGGSIFTGRLPASLGNLFRLETLEISSAGRLDANATIPASFSALNRLRTLILSGLGIGGEIPRDFFPSRLQFLDLSSNALVGAIPASIGEMRSLQTISLFNNSLTGEIPSSIGSLNRVSSLDFSANSLSGSIPGACLANLSLLQNLDFSENALSGGIPGEIGDLVHLTWLDLSANQLSGRIPVEFEQLTALQFFSVAENNLTGPIPSSLTSFDEISFANNNGLCDFPLPPCASKEP